MRFWGWLSRIWQGDPNFEIPEDAIYIPYPPKQWGSCQMVVALIIVSLLFCLAFAWWLAVAYGVVVVGYVRGRRMCRYLAASVASSTYDR